MTNACRAATVSTIGDFASGISEVTDGRTPRHRIVAATPFTPGDGRERGLPLTPQKVRAATHPVCRRRPRWRRAPKEHLIMRLRNTRTAAALASAALVVAAAGASASNATAAPAACATRVNNTVDRLLECVDLAGVREHQAAFQAIADDNGSTRVSGSPGYDESVAYVENRVRAAGWRVTSQPFQFQTFVSLQPFGARAGDRQLRVAAGAQHHVLLRQRQRDRFGEHAHRCSDGVLMPPTGLASLPATSHSSSAVGPTRTPCRPSRAPSRSRPRTR